MKSTLLILSIFFGTSFSSDLLSQKLSSKEMTLTKRLNDIVILKAGAIDKNLVIITPSLGKNVIGKISITGKANPNSSVKVEVSATYYKFIPDYKIEKLNKGDGPINVNPKNIIVKANASGTWTTKPVNFNNYGFSTIFKIVARSVEGNNATYVTVQNNKLPNIAWD